jgi:hypothetical protein
MCGTDVTRLEGFSDAVFTFAVTLLMVSLKVPTKFDGLLNSLHGGQQAHPDAVGAMRLRGEAAGGIFTDVRPRADDVGVERAQVSGVHPLERDIRLATLLCQRQIVPLALQRALQPL